MSRSPEPVRVAVANDYEVVVEGVATMLAPYPEVISVAHLLPGPEHVHDVDVVLYDMFGAPALGGERLHSLLTRFRRVVIYTWHTESDAVLLALGLGAAGFLGKSLSPQEVVDAVVAVHQGDRIVNLGRSQDTSHPGATATDPAASWPGQSAGLTPRESEILALMTQGHSDSTISALAHLDPDTLEVHTRTAYRRIGVTRRSQAIGWATRNGFRPDTDLATPSA